MVGSDRRNKKRLVREMLTFACTRFVIKIFIEPRGIRISIMRIRLSLSIVAALA